MVVGEIFLRLEIPVKLQVGLVRDWVVVKMLLGIRMSLSRPSFRDPPRSF